MKRQYSFQKAPRCSATSKRTRQACRAPAVRGCKVCRFHGAGGGAPKGRAHGRYKHGLFTTAAVSEQRLVKDIIRQSRQAIGAMAHPFDLPREG
jgi:hypothetical protein